MSYQSTTNTCLATTRWKLVQDHRSCQLVYQKNNTKGLYTQKCFHWDLVELLSKQLTTLCQLGWQTRYYSLGICQSTNLLDYILPLKQSTSLGWLVKNAQSTLSTSPYPHNQTQYIQQLQSHFPEYSELHD